MYKLADLYLRSGPAKQDKNLSAYAVFFLVYHKATSEYIFLCELFGKQILKVLLKIEIEIDPGLKKVAKFVNINSLLSNHDKRGK